MILTPKQIYYILGLQPRDKAAMFYVNTIVRIFSRRIYMKIEFSSQKREMLLSLITDQHGRSDVTCKPTIPNRPKIQMFFFFFGLNLP